MDISLGTRCIGHVDNIYRFRHARLENAEFGYWDLGVKKGGHMIGYALLGAAFCHALHGTRRAAKHFFIWAFVLTVLYAMSDEVHQTFTAGRTPAILDVGIDAIGGCMGIAAARWLRRRFPAEKTA